MTGRAGQMICHDCGHAQCLHDVWGTCTVLRCKKCHDEMVCPRCDHTFLEHISSERSAMCIARNCRFAVCYTQQHPERGVLKKDVPTSNLLNLLKDSFAEQITKPRPPAYEDMLPAIYRGVVSAPVVPIVKVEKGFIE